MWYAERTKMVHDAIDRTFYDAIITNNLLIDSKAMTFVNNTGKICAAIAGKTVAEILAQAKSAEAQADVIEIRLDTLSKPEITPFTTSLTAPLLFTNRAQWEGGNYTGEEPERLAFLHEAIKSGTAYVDIELKTDPSLRQDLLAAAKAADTATIVSWHSFDNTPSSPALNSILQEQYRSSADIGKIVTMAANFNDVLRVLSLQTIAAEMGFPLIAFCMGPTGLVSRIATLELGGFMTYAASDSGAGTAPGQLPLSSLKKIMTELINAM